MKTLVTYGSKRGGTAEIASVVADELRRQGIEADVLPATEVQDIDVYRAVIVGGALYAGRWQKDARRFVKRHASRLRTRSSWFFSSGPLDDTADQNLSPTGQVAKLMRLCGAQGHVTFGGRLQRDAQGFPASAMAKTHAGDWRNPDRIRAWTGNVGRAILASPLPQPLPVPATTVSTGGFLATLCLFAGVTAIWGGVDLMWRPDGSLMRLPLSLLEHSPFRTFFVPGALLAVVVGGLNTLAGIFVIRRHPRANAEAFVSGAVLTGWIVIEVLLIRHLHWLQGVYFALGLAIMLVALLGERHPGARVPALAARSWR